MGRAAPRACSAASAASAASGPVAGVGGAQASPAGGRGLSDAMGCLGGRLAASAARAAPGLRHSACSVGCDALANWLPSSASAPASPDVETHFAVGSCFLLIRLKTSR